MQSFSQIVADIVRTTGKAPTVYQSAIFDWIANGTGHGIVDAVAGSGKTTTVEQAVRFIPASKSILMVAFNKHIATELQGRMAMFPNVRACTLHSFGMAILRSQYGRKCKLDDDKTFKVAMDTAGWPKRGTPEFTQIVGIMAALKKLVSLCKANAFGTPIRPAATRSDVLDIAARYNVELPDSGELDWFMQTFDVVYAGCVSRTDIIDFDDMIFMPIAKGLAVPKSDFVFVDESQDLNVVQIELARAASAQGRAVFVGDPYQSIYGFRGANPEAIAHIAESFAAKSLPLSICWRCPKSVVAEAAKIVAHIIAAPNAIDGIVRNTTSEKYVDELRVGDFVLCRTTAPLVRDCLALIRKGVKAVVRGRDIGNGLVNLIAQIEKARMDGNVTVQIREYGNRECSRMNEREMSESQIEAFRDRIETLIVLSEECTDFDCLEAKIDAIFSDDTAGIVFSTAHRAKGLQTARVFIIRPELMPHPLAKLEWERTQEKNLLYVAVTRATHELVYVSTVAKAAPVASRPLSR